MKQRGRGIDGNYDREREEIDGTRLTRNELSQVGRDSFRSLREILKPRLYSWKTGRRVKFESSQRSTDDVLK